MQVEQGGGHSEGSSRSALAPVASQFMPLAYRNVRHTGENIASERLPLLAAARREPDEGGLPSWTLPAPPRWSQGEEFRPDVPAGGAVFGRLPLDMASMIFPTIYMLVSFPMLGTLLGRRWACCRCSAGTK